MTILRPYQQEGADGIRASFRARNRRVLYVLPTGGGKTTVFSYIVKCASEKGNSSLILAHRGVICDQISKELTKHGAVHGMIMQNRSRRFDVLAQVGTMATVVNRLDTLNPSLIVIDEAHRACGATYKKILERFPNAKVLLVTATPRRTDGKPMGDVADDMVLGPPVSWLMERGYLSQYRLFAPPPVADLDGVRTTAGDFNKGDLQEAMSKPEIVGDALEHYLRICPGKRFVAFTTGTLKSDEYAKRFTEGGVPTKNIDGTMKPAHINSVLRELEEGKIVGVTSCDLIGEGFDLPAVEVMIDLRPTMSLIVYLQHVGRVLRPSPGKPHAIILDHVGNSFRFQSDGTPIRVHGLPDEDREWSLEGKPKKKKDEKEGTIDSTRCGDCQGVYPGHMKHCPYCNSLTPTSNLREVEEVEGTLKDLTADKELYARLQRMNTNEFLTTDDATSPSMVKAFGKIKGHNPIWSLRTVHEKTGVSLTEAARQLGYKPAFARFAAKYIRPAV